MLRRALVSLVLLLVPAPALAHGGADDYRWVRPPAAGEWSDAAPDRRTAKVPASLLAAGPVDVWTPDLQAVAVLAAEPVGPGPVVVELMPHDAATLASLPDGLVAAGNAVRLDVRPAGASAASDATDADPGTSVAWRSGVELLLAVPHSPATCSTPARTGAGSRSRGKRRPTGWSARRRPARGSTSPSPTTSPAGRRS